MESKNYTSVLTTTRQRSALVSLCLVAFPRVVRLVAEHALSGKDFFFVKTLF